MATTAARSHPAYEANVINIPGPMAAKTEPRGTNQLFIRILIIIITYWSNLLK